MDIVGHIFYWKKSFHQESFLIDISGKRKKVEDSLFLSKRRESHLSREFDVIETFERNFSPSHSPPPLIVDARTYVIVRNDPSQDGRETSRLVSFGLEFSLLSRTLATFYRMESRKEKERKREKEREKEKAVAHEVARFETNPSHSPPSPPR